MDSLRRISRIPLFDVLNMQSVEIQPRQNAGQGQRL